MNKNLEILLEKIRSNRKLRIGAACESHLLFFAIYLSKYIKYQTAKFQQEIFELTQDVKNRMSVIVAFRDSAKSTICTTSFPLWSILTGQSHFVIISSGTRSKARQHLGNIREEVENNALLKNDLGPFKSETDEWGAFALTFPKYNAKIIAVSSEQSVRGLRYKNHRPDLMIADDLEDLESVRTQESRDKTYRWFKGELLPAGTRDTRVFVVGNLLHQDSLIVRLQKDIQSTLMPGEFRAYAILNDEGNSTWLGKYPNLDSVEEEKRKINDHITWEREYMLRIVSPDHQVIKRDWIQTYDYTDLPKQAISKICMGVDLAIKEEERHDFTAVVISKMYILDGKKVLYIDRTVNKKMDFPTAMDELRLLNHEYSKLGVPVEILIEDVSLQSAWSQQLKEYGVNARPIKIGHSKKGVRLSVCSQWVKHGRILFPKKGVGLLTEQIVNFGVEKKDDLADAFSLLAIEVLSEPLPTEPEIFILS